MLVLPDGFLYGHVTRGQRARRLAAAADAGRVLPELLRGRTSVGMRAQVAEIAVRRVTGLHGLDDVEPLGEDGTGLVVGPGRRRADGRAARPAPARRLRHQPVRRPHHPCGYSVDELVDLA